MNQPQQPMKNNYPTFPNPAGIGSGMGFETPQEAHPGGLGLPPQMQGQPMEEEGMTPWEMLKHAGY